MMEEFVTIDYLGTLVGCVAIVTAIVQILKTYVPRIDAKWWALIGSFAVIVLRQIFFVQDLTAGGWAAAFLNLIICLVGSSGAYSYVVKPVVAKIIAGATDKATEK